MLEQQQELDLDEGSSSSWRLLQLPDVLAQHVLSFLPENTVPYAVRLTCKDAAARFDSPQHKTLHVGPKHPPIPASALLARWGPPGSTSSLTCRQRYTLLSAAARAGDIPTVQQLLITTGCILNLDIISTAAESRQAALVSWLLQHEDCPITRRTRPYDLKEASVGLMKAAISSGSTVTCKTIHRELLKLTWPGFDPALLPDLTAAAVRSGSPAVCTWLRRDTVFGLAHNQDDSSGSDRSDSSMNTQSAPGAGSGGDAAAGGLPAEEQLPEGVCIWEWALEQMAQDNVEMDPGDFLSEAAHDCDMAALQRVYDKYVYGSRWHPGTGSISSSSPSHSLDSENGGTDDDDTNDWSDVDARAEVLVAALCSPTPDWELKVRWLLAKGYPRDIYCCAVKLASCSYAVERMQWMRANGVTLQKEEEERVLYEAASRGSVPLVRYLLDQGILQQAGGKGAGSYGHASSDGGDGSSDSGSWRTEATAGGAGEGEGCKDYEEESDWNDTDDPVRKVLVAAAEHGHLDLLKLLVGLGYALRPDMLWWGAAWSGNVDLVEWCLEQLCGEGDGGTGSGSGGGDASGAAGSGEAAGAGGTALGVDGPAGEVPPNGRQQDHEQKQEEEQQQQRERQQQNQLDEEEDRRRRRERRLLNPTLMDEAARSGSTALVQWLHARGCAWDWDALRVAASQGSQELVEWMAGVGFAMPADGAPYLFAGGNGDLAMMATLKRLGCSFGPQRGAKMFAKAVQYRARLPVLKWLYGNGCRAVWSKGMAKARDPQVADWLRATVQGQAEGGETQAASKHRKGVRVRQRV